MKQLIQRLRRKLRSTGTLDASDRQPPAMRNAPSHQDTISSTSFQDDPGDATISIEKLVAEADRLRDISQPVDAAHAYAAALSLCPWRTDLKVQQGNMLKDAGQLLDAQQIYQDALTDDPDDPDIHLQLGHVLKLMGRRTAALAFYQAALRLDPTMQTAHLELVQAGSVQHQLENIDAQRRAHGLDRMLSLSAQLYNIKLQMSRIERELPDLSAWTAVPAGEYGLFRRLFDIPPPPPLIGKEIPTIRLIIHPDTAPVARLHTQLASFLAQTSDHWEATFIGSEPDRRLAVARLALANPRLRWLDVIPGESEAAQEQRAAAGFDGWLWLLADGAVLHRHAIAWFGTVAAQTTAVLLFSDEEETVEEDNVAAVDRSKTLIARWSFDPEILLQANIYGNSLAVRTDSYRTWVNELAASDQQDTGTSGRRSSLLLAVGTSLNSGAHIPFALVESVAEAATPRHSHLDAHAAAVEQAISRQTLSCKITLPGQGDADRLLVDWPEAEPATSITVIITTRNNAKDCTEMVDSLLAQADHPCRIQCIVVDNGSDQPADLFLLGLLGERRAVRLLRLDEPFNWSRLNNYAAGMVTTSLLVFANDDMKMLSQGWDHQLATLLARPNIGAVGARLLYTDGTMQHGGILFGWKGSVIHDGLYEPRDSVDQSMRWQLTRSVSAVTGAFLGIRLVDFLEVGGFDDAQLPIGYSDVDIALKLRAAGRQVLWTPRIELTHFESKSRGLDHLQTERRARGLTERQIIEQRWGVHRFDSDPSFNPTWLDATLPFRLLRTVTAEKGLAHALHMRF